MNKKHKHIKDILECFIFIIVCFVYTLTGCRICMALWYFTYMLRCVHVERKATDIDLKLQCNILLLCMTTYIELICELTNKLTILGEIVVSFHRWHFVQRIVMLQRI